MKVAYSILLITGEKKATDLLKLFLKEALRFLGLPLNIVSDQDSRFTSKFLKPPVEALDFRLKISSPFCSQTDWQTNRLIPMLEYYLMNQWNYKQDNRSEKFPMSEHAYNNPLTTAMGMAPLFANFRFDP
jgi:hypothetical protein